MEFDKAEPVAPQPAAAPAAVPTTPAAPAVCAACKQTLVGQYWDAGGQSLCQNCSQAVQQAWDARTGSILSALGRGGVTALLGGIGWAVITRVSGYELGIVAIFVGAWIGTAVKKASGNRGGAAYQAIAVGFTYLAATSRFIPDVYGAILKDDLAPSGLKMVIAAIVSFFTSLIGPFLDIHPISLLILGFALVQAWRVNKRVELKVTGPFELKT